ncbi:FG-GAP repeat domain-containing protein [Alkalinema pantanalense CENA528]|uniref:FG-GAP repeat domain-containing protein n=1 Tax=Alkalinema pantanalense TaxID=1620705 RepID=UPI003D6F5734
MSFSSALSWETPAPLAIQSPNAFNSTQPLNTSLPGAPVPTAASSNTELLFRNIKTGQTQLWEIQPDQTIVTHDLPTVSDPAWQVAARGDFDRDGDQDLLWYNDLTGALSFWKLTGCVYEASIDFGAMQDLGWQVAGVADFNQDQKTDLLWRNRRTGDLVTWHMNGFSIVGAASLGTVADTAWEIVGVGDFNGDKQVDLFWRHGQQGYNTLWHLTGAGQFASATALPTVADANWLVKGIADMDHDGQLDIIWEQTVASVTAIWQMDGTTVQAGYNITQRMDPNWLIQDVGDLNNDGTVDILWRNRLTGSMGFGAMDDFNLVANRPLTSLDPNWQLETCGQFS